SVSVVLPKRVPAPSLICRNNWVGSIDTEQRIVDECARGATSRPHAAGCNRGSDACRSAEVKTPGHQHLADPVNGEGLIKVSEIIRPGLVTVATSYDHEGQRVGVGRVYYHDALDLPNVGVHRSVEKASRRGNHWSLRQEAAETMVEENE